MTSEPGTDDVPAQVPGDGALIDRCREGEDADAYELLYQRHAEAAGRLARRLTRSRDRADDLVAEAFTRVLSALRRGLGPDVAFRAYLLTVVRNVAAEWASGDRRITLVEGYDELERPSGGDDPVIARAERDLATRAFNGLPERWRAVLWHTEVEGETPASIAPLLGLSPNAVAALAVRAREGLRQQYLQAHLSSDVPEPCRGYTDRLARLARGRLVRGKRADLQQHMDNCARCSALYAELVQANTGLGALIGTAVLGPLAAVYGTAGVAAATGASGAGAGVGAWLARLRPRNNPGPAVAAGVAVVVVAASAFAAVRLTGDDHPTPRHGTTAAAPGGQNGSGGSGGSGGGSNGSGGSSGSSPGGGHHGRPSADKPAANKPAGHTPRTDPSTPSSTPPSTKAPSGPDPSASHRPAHPQPPAPSHRTPSHRTPSHHPPSHHPPSRHTPTPPPTHPTPPTKQPEKPTPTPTKTCTWYQWQCWLPEHVHTRAPHTPRSPALPLRGH